MKKIMCTLLFCVVVLAQDNISIIQHIDIEKAPQGKISKYWLHMLDDGLSQPVYVPVIIARGVKEGPVLGLVAAIHGNELNGIPVIQEVLSKVDMQSLSGTIIGVPGLNPISMSAHRRRFIDDEDLNRNFPGKQNGNRSEQYVWKISNKILKHFHYLADLHTASFGRINSLYVRANMQDNKVSEMAYAQDADIILHNISNPKKATWTLRYEAEKMSIPTITIEYCDPQVYQPTVIKRGVTGIFNLMVVLNMLDNSHFKNTQKPILCEKSYWIYTDKGGLLDIPVQLLDVVEKDQIIGVLKNPFGDIIRSYTCPEKGVVIGKSSNPVNIDGGRILHLGIISTAK